MNSSKKKSHSVKKDFSSSSQREEGESESSVIERHTQQIPDALRLRTRNIARYLESEQQPRKRVRKMKKGLADGSKLESRSSSATISSSSYVNEYFNDDEEEDLVIIDSDGEEKKRRKKKKDEEVEHVTKFARSEKSELIELIYGSEKKTDKISSKFSYHNLQNDGSDEEMDETCSLNPILPGQNGPKVKPKKIPQKVSRVRILLMNEFSPSFDPFNCEGKKDSRMEWR